MLMRMIVNSICECLSTPDPFPTLPAVEGAGEIRAGETGKDGLTVNASEFMPGMKK
jgi:hypothetical protein